MANKARFSHLTTDNKQKLIDTMREFTLSGYRVTHDDEGEDFRDVMMRKEQRRVLLTWERSS
jgi:hypothetical protein